MYDLTTLLTTIAGCTATIVAILGGFIASKLIALSTERNEIIARLSEIKEELNFQKNAAVKAKKDLNEEDALDFIKGNLESAIDNIPLDLVYKNEERFILSFKELEPFWKKAIKTIDDSLSIIRDEAQETNEDGIPNCIASTADYFEYEICGYLNEIYVEEPLYNMLNSDENLRQEREYRKKLRNEIEKANEAFNWLDMQKNQLEKRKEVLKKPKGMLSGLIIFALFSFFGVAAPLIAVPFTTSNYSDYILIKSLSIGVLVLGLIAVFIYLVTLLRWKEKEEVKE